MLVATLAAVAAAALFAAATAVLHRSAGIVSAGIVPSEGAPTAAVPMGPVPYLSPATTEASRRHLSLDGPALARFVAATARHPLWLLGMLGELLGFVLHALALRDGPLTLVQPLLITGVVFALPLRQLMERRRPGQSELLWAALLACGLALFFVTASPGQAPHNFADPLAAAVAVGAVGTGIALCAFLGRRAEGPRSAAALGAGAGLAFAGVAGLLKEATAQLNAGMGTLVGNWELYALVLCGGAGLLLSQLAFRAAPLSASLPTLTTIDPIASLAIGVAVFGEPFRTSPAALSGEIGGLLLVIAAAAALTRAPG